MKVTFLGTGDFYPKSLGHASVLLEWGDTNMAVDFPATNAHALERLGMELHMVQSVFVTHLHEDHVNGIQQYAYWCDIMGSLHGRRNRPHLYIPAELLQPFWETVRGGLALTTKGERALEHYFEIHAVPRDNPVFEAGGQTFRVIPTEHVPGMPSFGLLAPPYFYYSGDSRVNGDYLLSILDEVKTIFHDCHLWDLPIASHASLQDIRALPQTVIDKTVLMHYNFNYERPEARRELELREKVRLADPLQTFTFGKV